jgi:hypothetical protein
VRRATVSTPSTTSIPGPGDRVVAHAMPLATTAELPPRTSAFVSCSWNAWSGRVAGQQADGGARAAKEGGAAASLKPGASSERQQQQTGRRWPDRVCGSVRVAEHLLYCCARRGAREEGQQKRKMQKTKTYAN